VHGGGEQRLADLPPGELLFLEQDNAVSSHRDQRRQRGSAWSATDDDNFGFFA
jgi:hypothetical protein